MMSARICQPSQTWFATERQSDSELERRVAGRAWERNHIADILHPRDKHHHAFKTQPETGVWRGAELAQFQIPPVVFLIQPHLADAAQQHIVALLALDA